MKTKVARKHKITIPYDIWKKARIAVGCVMDISNKHGKIHVENIDENWDQVMKETRGAWHEHPVFKEMNDAVEIVNLMRGTK